MCVRTLLGFITANGLGSDRHFNELPGWRDEIITPHYNCVRITEMSRNWRACVHLNRVTSVRRVASFFYFFVVLSWVFACLARACVRARQWRGRSPSANQRGGTDASACEKVEK